MLSLSPTLSLFIYTPSSIPSTLFTLYSPLYSTFNTPGYSGLLRVTGLLVTRVTGLLGLPGYSGYSSANHLPFIIIYSSHLYPSSLPLFPTAYTSHYSPYLSFSIYYPFLYSAPSLLPLLIISHFHLFSSLFPPKLIYSLISFPLPTYLLYLTPPYIFQITYLLHFLNSPLYIPNYLLTSFPQLTFIYSKLLLLPLLISSLSYSPYPIQHYFPYSSPLYPFLYHIKSLLTLIFTTQLIPLLLQKILPLKSFSFPFYYSLFPISN